MFGAKPEIFLNRVQAGGGGGVGGMELEQDTPLEAIGVAPYF